MTPTVSRTFASVTYGASTNAGTIFQSAAGFEAAADILWADLTRKMRLLKMELRDISASSSYYPSVEPAITVLTFALELYFKALICIDKGSSVKGHKLIDLFNQLLPDRKKRLAELFDIEAMNDVWWQRLHKEKPAWLVDYSLEKVLKKSNDAFQDWRYYFESIGKSCEFVVSSVVPALRRLILEIKPEWASSIDPDSDAGRSLAILRK
jgi:hypothetical protein